MVETAAQQRVRIIIATGDVTRRAFRNYDLAVKLGYQPESWDGMWKLSTKPFIRVWPFVICREHTGRDDNSRVRYIIRWAP